MDGKHAYLIMAHHRFDILQELITDLDDDRNDIFLHVDVKSKDFDKRSFRPMVTKGVLYIVKRMNVRWGGYSQIECILMLLRKATEQGYHDYYHFMVGVEFPLKSQDVIHKFFNDHEGKEFIGFCYEGDYLDRVRYYHPFNEYARNNNYYQKALNKIRIFSVFAQRKLGVDISKKYGIPFRKGNANWSITDALARKIVSEEKTIRKIYRHSWCGDEVFVHTIVYNSEFWNGVYDKEDEYHSSMRTMTWETMDNCYHVTDLDYLLSCGRLFARKIDGNDAVKLIGLIKAMRDDTVQK